MVSIAIYVGGTVISGPFGVAYNIPPRTVFTTDVNITLDLLRRLIYQHLGMLESQCSLKISAKVNVGGPDGVFYSQYPLIDDGRLSLVVSQNPSLELYVDIIPHISSTSYVPTAENLPGSSNQANWNVPQYQANWNVPHYQPYNIPQYPPQYHSQPLNPYYQPDYQSHPQYPPQYPSQPLNPYYQTSRNAPQYEPPNVRQYESQAEPDYSYYETHQHYSPPPSPPRPNIPQASNRDERSSGPTADDPTDDPTDDEVDPVADYYNSGNESPLYDTDDEEAERMAEEDEGADDSSSSSDDDEAPTPAGGGVSRQVPLPFINRGIEQPFRFFHSSATEEVESDAITYGRKKAFDHPLAVGRKFPDKEALIKAVQEFHINENRPYKTVNSNKSTYVAVCEREPLCKWRLYASSKDKMSFTIKTNPYDHSCEAIVGRRDHRQLTAKFLARVIYNAVAANPGISMRDLSSLVEVKFDQKTTYNKLWRAKEKAIAAAFGSWSEAYALLPNLLEAYARKNPGTRYVVLGDPISSTDHLFTKAAWSWGACREGLRHCRPVFGIDATFLTGRYKGKLLVATAHDANNQLFPFAYGLVDAEDNSSWAWWMRWLRCNVLQPGIRYTVISDRHPSIRNVFLRTDMGFCEARGEAFHRFCARHIAENVRKTFDKRSKELFETTAYTKGLQRHHDAFDLLREYNLSAWCYVYDIGKRGNKEERALQNPPKELWAACKDGGTNRWGIMTSNGPESLNKVYKDARALPVTALVDETFAKTMEWFANRRELARVNLESGKQWAPNVANKIQRRTRKSQAHKVKTVNHDQMIFQVTGKEGKEGKQKRFKYNVQLYPTIHLSSCGCGKPDLTGVPCAHVIAVLSKRRYSTAEFVSRYYNSEHLFRTWEPILMPFTTAEDYPNIGGPRFVPDHTKVTKGRRKHLRMPMTMDQMEREKKKKHSYRCSRCGEQGHTKNKCRVPFEYAEAAQTGRHSFSGTASSSHTPHEVFPSQRHSVSGVPRPVIRPEPAATRGGIPETMNSTKKKKSIGSKFFGIFGGSSSRRN